MQDAVQDKAMAEVEGVATLGAATTGVVHGVLVKNAALATDTGLLAVLSAHVARTVN